MTRYRQRPNECEAIQWTGDNADALRAFADGNFNTVDPEDRIDDPDQDAQLLVEDSHWVGIGPGDWVLKFEGYFIAKSDGTFRSVWEPAVVSVPPPADRATLREQIAAAMREHWLCTVRDEADADGNLPCRCGDWREPGAEADDDNDWHSHMADAVLAVLPEQTDRAALTEVRKLVRRLAAHAEGFRDVLDDSDRDPWAKTVRADIAALTESVNQADEAAAPLSPDYEHPECGFHWHGRDDMDIPMRDGQPVCPRCELRRLAAEQPTETQDGEAEALWDELHRRDNETDQPNAAETQEPETEEQRVRAHVTTLHLIGEQLAGVESWMWEHLANVRNAERSAVGERPDTAEHVCKPGAARYFCPTSGKTESTCHGGFDVCCDRPDLHQLVGVERPDTQTPEA
ncbi:hypothetical protein ACWD3J_14155 [Streptomyces sp. NPDC002755]